MDPLTVTVVTILGKCAIDKGVELAKEVGPRAAEAAAQLSAKVMDRFSKNPADAVNAQRSEKKPESYKAPIQDSLDEYLMEPQFAAEIKALVEQYKAQAPPAATGTFTIIQTGGDNAIQFGNVSGGSIDIGSHKCDH